MKFFQLPDGTTLQNVRFLNLRIPDYIMRNILSLTDFFQKFLILVGRQVSCDS